MQHNILVGEMAKKANKWANKFKNVKSIIKKKPGAEMEKKVLALDKVTRGYFFIEMP